MRHGQYSEQLKKGFSKTLYDDLKIIREQIMLCHGENGIKDKEK